MPIVCDLYCRVSTTEQAVEGYSLGEQEARLRAFASSQGWMVNDVLVDGGYSGAKLDRPGIQKVIQDAESGRINMVATYKLDRLSRSQKDTLYLIEDVFLAHGVNYVSMTESFNSSTPFGKATLGLLSVFAQLERDQIKERMSMGRMAVARSGRFTGSTTSVPIGYRLNAKKLGGDSRLVQVPEEAAIVRRVFELFEMNYSFKAIYRRIDEEFPGRERVKACNNIPLILRNRIYIGQFSWGGELHQSDDIDPILDEDTFWRVQKKLADYQAADYDGKTAKPIRETSHPLNGFIWCGECGERFRYKAKRKIWPSGHTAVYEAFACRSKYYKTEKECHQQQIRARELEGYIWDQLESLRFEDLKVSSVDHSEEIESINKKISSIDQRIGKLIDLYSLDSIDFNQLEQKAAELKEQKIGLKRTLDRLQTDATDNNPEIIKTALESLKRIRESGTDEEKRDIYRILLKKVIIGPGDDITIIFNI